MTEIEQQQQWNKMNEVTPNTVAQQMAKLIRFKQQYEKSSNTKKAGRFTLKNHF